MWRARWTLAMALERVPQQAQELVPERAQPRGQVLGSALNQSALTRPDGAQALRVPKTLAGALGSSQPSRSCRRGEPRLSSP